MLCDEFPGRAPECRPSVGAETPCHTRRNRTSCLQNSFTTDGTGLDDWPIAERELLGERLTLPTVRAFHFTDREPPANRRAGAKRRMAAQNREPLPEMAAPASYQSRARNKHRNWQDFEQLCQRIILV